MGRNADKPMTMAEPLMQSAASPVLDACKQERPVLSTEGQSWPLSFGQQRLWFLDHLEPDSALYNMPCLLRVSGPLNFEALGKAVHSLTSRHEALRSRFPCECEQPRQVIDPEITIPISVFDCTALSALERDDKVRQLVREEINRPFDLATGPLLRLMLIRCGEAEHFLTVTMHHIVSDEWSLKIIFEELGQWYE
jgi:NRPS condensation-like uncharacterized protein